MRKEHDDKYEYDDEPHDVPDWAWHITWGIQIAGIIFSIVAIVIRLIR